MILSMVFSGGCASSKNDIMQTGGKDNVSDLKRITGISTVDDTKSMSIRIQGNHLLTYTSVKQPSPLAVLLYFPETELDDTVNGYQVLSAPVQAVKALELDVKGKTTKVEITLDNDLPYQVSREGNDLTVIFEKNTYSADKNEVLAEREDDQAAYPSSGNMDKLMTPQPSPSVKNVRGSDADTGFTWVNRIDFISEEAGKSTVIIGTIHKAAYDIRKIGDKNILLNVYDTKLPEYHQRQLITTRFESAVNRITPIQITTPKETTARFLIELRQSVPYLVEQDDNMIRIHFEASSVPPKPVDQAKLPDWERVLSEARDITAPAEKLTGGYSAETSSTPAQKYTGEKIALDFYETDIKNVFRILRKISGKNFAIDKDVTGKVTLALDKPVPWDQVLDLILKMNQLGQITEGDVIRIATIATLKKEEADKRAELIASQKAAEEKIAVEPLITEYIPVNYSNAKNEILPHLEKILTKDRGSISVDERSNLVIITDVAGKINQAKEIVHRLDTVTPQVIIEARIVEANTNFSREIGTKWSADGGIQNTDPNTGIGPQRGYDTLGGTYGWDAAVNLPGNIGETGGTVGFSFNRIAGTPLLLNAKLLAMETQGEGKIISAPKVVTLDNKKAIIKQGLKYPYLERDEAGLATVKFEDIDLLLEVIPHVTPDSRISMNINITKNDIGQQYEGIQSFTTKEAQTELLVNDGDTVVIGGIIKKTNNKSEDGIPGFSKIPLIGWLFKTKSNSDIKEELLIFITPKIVQLEQRSM